MNLPTIQNILYWSIFGMVWQTPIVQSKLPNIYINMQLSNHINHLSSEIKRAHGLTLIFGMFSMSWRAMSLQPSCTALAGISPSEYQSRSTQWAYAALGVAWVTRVVVTMPTDFPDEDKRQGAKVWPQGLFLDRHLLKSDTSFLLVLTIQEYILADILIWNWNLSWSLL